MIKLYDNDGKLVEVQLEKGEQLYLMKQNIKMLKQYDKNNNKEISKHIRGRRS